MVYFYAWLRKCLEIFHWVLYKDKETIESACSSANKSTLAYLPILGAGEAILMGVDFPMPVMLKVDLPQIEPNSHTPQFSIK